MNDRTQRAIDRAEHDMTDALRLTYSGRVGTRMLRALVSVLARQFLSLKQQAQVEVILNLHEKCVRHDGEMKQRG